MVFNAGRCLRSDRPEVVSPFRARLSLLVFFFGKEGRSFIMRKTAYGLDKAAKR